jgi:hypothetical protein
MIEQTQKRGNSMGYGGVEMGWSKPENDIVFSTQHQEKIRKDKLKEEEDPMTESDYRDFYYNVHAHMSVYLDDNLRKYARADESHELSFQIFRMLLAFNDMYYQKYDSEGRLHVKERL